MRRFNKKEQLALRKLWCQNDQGMTYRRFRRTAWYSGFVRCVMVPWCGMTIGIESDGHTHS